jgi:hypothetical protein
MGARAPERTFTAAPGGGIWLLNVMYFLFGIAAMLVAVGLLFVFARVNRTLRAMEELVLLTTDEMRATLPEVRESLGTVNDIATGVNVAMRSAGGGLGQLGRRLRISVESALYGARAAGESLQRAEFQGMGTEPRREHHEEANGDGV